MDAPAMTRRMIRADVVVDVAEAVPTPPTQLAEDVANSSNGENAQRAADSAEFVKFLPTGYLQRSRRTQWKHEWADFLRSSTIHKVANMWCSERLHRPKSQPANGPAP